MAEVVLVRHGQTQWSRDGRHTRLHAQAEPDLLEWDDSPEEDGHALRVLAACWLGLSPHVGQQLVLEAGSISVLGHEHGSTAVLSWNG